MSLEFSGLVLPFNQYHLLVYGPDAQALGVPKFGPPVYLHPGYRFFTRPDYLIPTEVIDDIGQRFAPPECYAWLEMQGDLFPRSDAAGFLAAGGRYAAFVKELDLTEIALFASDSANSEVVTRVDLAIEAQAAPDGFALLPVEFPVAWLARAAPCYRLSPGVFGAAGAAILNQLLANRFRDWRLTFDDIDDLTEVS